jgi:hypothetical protein
MTKPEPMAATMYTTLDTAALSNGLSTTSAMPKPIEMAAIRIAPARVAAAQRDPVVFLIGIRFLAPMAHGSASRNPKLNDLAVGSDTDRLTVTGLASERRAPYPTDGPWLVGCRAPLSMRAPRPRDGQGSFAHSLPSRRQQLGRTLDVDRLR